MDGVEMYIGFGDAGDRVHAFGSFNQGRQHTACGQAAIIRDGQTPLQITARNRGDLAAIIATLPHGSLDIRYCRHPS